MNTPCPEPSSTDPIAFGDALAARRAASIAVNVERWRAWMAAELPAALVLGNSEFGALPGLWPWMFPTGAASRLEPDAPRIGRRELAEAVQADPERHEALEAAFERAARFLGLVMIDGALQWAQRPQVWAFAAARDWRVYRMLRCLHVAGLADEAAALMAFLERWLADDQRRAAALCWYRHQVAS